MRRIVLSCSWLVATAIAAPAFADPATDPAADPAADARALRQTAVVEVAPAPPATGQALLGPAGVDATGQPTQYVDGPGLRTLLRQRRFADLDKHLAHFQTQAEADARRAVWLDDAVRALAAPVEDARPGLDAWVQAAPGSFAAVLVRGVYGVRTAHALRGAYVADDTPDSDFAAMQAALPAALADLERALTLRKKLGTARAWQIQALLLAGDAAGLATTAQLAFGECPGCLAPRIVHVQALRPRWGGSHAAMADAIRAAPVATQPHLAVLAGYIELDRAQGHRSERRRPEALAAMERACAGTEHAPFLVERADAKWRHGDLPGALVDLERAAALRPGDPAVAIDRARALMARRRYLQAGAALLTGLRTEPTDSKARKMKDDLVRGLVRHAWEQQEAGHRDAALDAYDLAGELAPGDREVTGRRQALLLAGDKQTVTVPAEIVQAVAERPDDFRAAQTLDYALARRGRYEEVVTLWHAFLARNPEHGMAYLERGGAFFHLRRLAEAAADVRKACELGVAEGCLRAKQLGGGR